MHLERPLAFLINNSDLTVRNRKPASYTMHSMLEEHLVAVVILLPG